jgi:hypothetical protein
MEFSARSHQHSVHGVVFLYPLLKAESQPLIASIWKEAFPDGH